jgi:hypothetical protein
MQYLIYELFINVSKINFGNGNEAEKAIISDLMINSKRLCIKIIVHYVSSRFLLFNFKVNLFLTIFDAIFLIVLINFFSRTHIN